MLNARIMMALETLIFLKRKAKSVDSCLGWRSSKLYSSGVNIYWTVSVLGYHLTLDCLLCYCYMMIRVITLLKLFTASCFKLNLYLRVNYFLIPTVYGLYERSLFEEGYQVCVPITLL